MRLRIMPYLLCLLLSAAPAGATVFRAADTVTIDPGETIDDDLFVAGTSVLVAGTVTGDVLAAGDTVRVTGPVGGTVLAGGRDVRVTGDVSGSALTAGQSVTLAGTVGRNVVAAGQEVLLEKTAAVSRDVHAAANQISLEGSVGRDAWLVAAQGTVRGTIGQLLRFEGDQLRLGPRARVGANLVYRSPQQPVMEQGATVLGATERLPSREPRRPKPRPLLAIVRPLLMPLLLISFPVVLVFGLIGLALAPRVFVASANAVGRRAWWSLLLGLLVLIFGPVALFFAMSTVVALPVAFLALIGWLSILAFSEVPVAIFLGRKIIHLFVNGPANPYAGLFFGLLALTVLALIPVIGPPVSGLALLIGVGAYSRSLKGLVVEMRRHPA